MRSVGVVDARIAIDVLSLGFEHIEEIVTRWASAKTSLVSGSEAFDHQFLANGVADEREVHTSERDVCARDDGERLTDAELLGLGRV